MNKRCSVVVLAAVVLAGCQNGESTSAAPAQMAAAPLKDVASTSGQPEVAVYKSPTCGCCGLWVEHLQTHGFPVKVSDVDNLAPIKEQAGIPPGLGSCHTARVGDYFIEGHVPAADIQRLLAEKPRARGLAVPGMPIGSPGMEQGGRVEAYDVLLVHEDGSTSVFAHHAGEEQIVQEAHVH